MKRSFRGRQRKDQPAITGVNRRKVENIAEKGAVRLWILTVNNDVGPSNHDSRLSRNRVRVARTLLSALSAASSLHTRGQESPRHTNPSGVAAQSPSAGLRWCLRRSCTASRRGRTFRRDNL